MMTSLLPRLNSDLSDLADRVRQSLVQVSVENSGSGSGVVIAADGLVVTDAHVVSARRHGGGALRVTLPDGSVVTSRLLAKDNGIDVALLRIEPVGGKLPELSPIDIGDSKKPPERPVGDGDGPSLGRCRCGGGYSDRRRPGPSGRP